MFGTSYSSMDTVLARTFKIRYGPDVCCRSLLYILLAKVSVDDYDVVAKDDLSTKTWRPPWNDVVSRPW